MTKEKIYEILSSLSVEMKIPSDYFGFDKNACYGAIKQLQEQGLVDGFVFAVGGWDPNPRTIWMDQAYVTAQGLDFIDKYKKTEIDLSHELISACAKIADNPVSYDKLDEDGLNREVRNFLDSAISRFGYTVADQTQQGSGNKNAKPGELDIRINKDGIPVAIFEGLIHRDKQYLFDHISKSINKYNRSGCKVVFVVEYSRNRGFGGFWDSAYDAMNEYKDIGNIHEENTRLLGVRMLRGEFEWEGQKGDFYYIGVNCYMDKSLINMKENE